MIRGSTLRRGGPSGVLARRNFASQAPIAVASPHAWHRLYAAGAATSIWAAGLPLAISVVPSDLVGVVAVPLLVLTICLSSYACSIRPFCTDLMQEERVDVEDAHTHAGPITTGGALDDLDHFRKGEMLRPRFSVHQADKGISKSQEGAQEGKVLLLLLALVAAVGSVVCFVHGGAMVAHAWGAKGADGCSVMDLVTLQRDGYVKFFCRDGVIDKHHEKSLLHTGKHFSADMKVYRMAPVYLSAGDSAPVAWAISKNRELPKEPCGEGLCGILEPDVHRGGSCNSLLCFSEEDRAFVQDLIGVLVKDLKLEEGPDFNPRTIPLLDAANPNDPAGHAMHLVLALVLYVIALAGLLNFHLDIHSEEKVRRPEGHAGTLYRCIGDERQGAFRGNSFSSALHTSGEEASPQQSARSSIRRHGEPPNNGKDGPVRFQKSLAASESSKTQSSTSRTRSRLSWGQELKELDDEDEIRAQPLMEEQDKF